MCYKSEQCTHYSAESHSDARHTADYIAEIANEARNSCETI